LSSLKTNEIKLKLFQNSKLGFKGQCKLVTGDAIKGGSKTPDFGITALKTAALSKLRFAGFWPEKMQEPVANNRFWNRLNYFRNYRACQAGARRCTSFALPRFF
jgi:hypothetical protein